LAETIFPVRLSNRRSSQRPFLSVSKTTEATRLAASPPSVRGKGVIFDTELSACRSMERKEPAVTKAARKNSPVSAAITMMARRPSPAERVLVRTFFALRIWPAG
jgi:hypothetical protein